MKKHITTILLAALSVVGSAQKITLGSATTKDGGDYQGEMVAGKPQGKGKAVYKNGKKIYAKKTFTLNKEKTNETNDESDDCRMVYPIARD